MLFKFLPVAAGLGVLLAAASAAAGTKGGLYDMSAMLNQGHPFATPGRGLAPTMPPPSRGYVPTTLPPGPAMTPIAPPSPTLRYTPPPRPVAQAGVTGPYRPFGDVTDSGWFSRFYLSGGAGLHFPGDLDGSTAGATYSIEFDQGFAVQAALGAHLGAYQNGGFRLEGEVAYRMADYDRASAGGVSVTPTGDLKMATAMANLIYDVDLGWSFVPYVGAGLGLAQIKSGDTAIGGLAVSGKDATELAYQGIVGIAYQYDRSWSIGLDARYLGTSDEDVSATAITLNLRYSL